MKIAIVDSGLGLVYFLKSAIEKEIKQDIHLLFSSFFPLGNSSSSTLIAEGKDIYKKIKDEGYDLTFVCCNTLSFYIPDDERIVKILNCNREYLEKHPRALPIGTVRTIENLGRGYGDPHLAVDIEADDFDKVTSDILAWPEAEEYLLCCTHYSLIRDYAQRLHSKSRITDLIEKFSSLLSSLPQEERMMIDFGGRKEQIQPYLRF